MTRIALIGAGHLGRIHARLLASLNEVTLVAVVDPAPENRALAAELAGCPAVSDYHEILDQFDAAVVAAPTFLHGKIGSDLLKRGKHVFMEKPIASTVEEARALVELAQKKGLVLQVGHVERFNPAFEAASSHLAGAKYIEATRAGVYGFRCLDAGVVLDLMIHDIDLVLSLVCGELLDVQALGLAVLGNHEDLAQARLTFSCGAVANLTASRVHFAAERAMRVFTPQGFTSIDFAAPELQTVSAAPEVLSRGFDPRALDADQQQRVKDRFFEQILPKQQKAVEPQNAILEEQHDFVRAITTGGVPRVSGKAGLAALEVAQRVLDSIAAHRWTGVSPGPVGPLALPADFGVKQPLRKAG